MGREEIQILSATKDSEPSYIVRNIYAWYKLR
jgi:hypothetical protein